MTDKEKHQMLFIQLISSLQAGALQQMGKIKNPTTDAIERDLTQAEFTIDMIDMLVAKTKGNNSPEEDRFLTTLLAELKLNYVDEKSKEQKPQ